MMSLNFGRLAGMVILLVTASSFTAQAQGPDTPQNNPPSSEFSMRALQAGPGLPSLYDVRFTTADTLEREAELVFEFPAALDLSLLEVASSTTITGGFKITRERNVVRVRRTGLGDVVLPNRQVELKLGLIKSPELFSGNLAVSFTQVRASGKPAAAKKSYPIQFVPKAGL